MKVSDFGSQPGCRSRSSSAEFAHTSSSAIRANQRSTPARSGMGKPVSRLIHQPMGSATQLSASGFVVARMYGRTPQVERLRERR